MKEILRKLEQGRKKHLGEISRLKRKAKFDPKGKADYFREIGWIYAFAGDYTKSDRMTRRYEKYAIEYMRKRIKIAPKNGQYYAELAGMLKYFSHARENCAICPDPELAEKMYWQALKLGTKNDAHPWFSLALIYCEKAEQALQNAYSANLEYYAKVLKIKDGKSPRTAFELMYEAPIKMDKRDNNTVITRIL